VTRKRSTLYRCAGTAVLRASSARPGPGLPPWPAPDGAAGPWRAWLAVVWADNPFQQAVTVASPDLADQVAAVLDGQVTDSRRARRASLSVARYAIRYTRRSTPFGLFAGVAPVRFGGEPAARVGAAHETFSRPGPEWLDVLISAIEADSSAMADVEVMVNNLAAVRDGRVWVPAEGGSEFSLKLTPAVALVLETARSPVQWSALAGKLAAELPQAEESRCKTLVTELLRTRVLRSSLRVPATVTDPASALPVDSLPARGGRGRIAVDMRLDASVRLPDSVATETETAATVLARLAAHPSGTPAWQRYIAQFSARWGDGGEVGLEQLISPDTGLGLTDGFSTASEPPRTLTLRDRMLLELAGTAALEGRQSAALTEDMITALEAAAGGPARALAPHFEVCAQVEAGSLGALARGNFRLRVNAVSRSAGTMTGRFWHILPEAAAGVVGLSTVDPEAELAQLSFHPSRVTADPLARAPQVLPKVVSLGEFRGDRDNVLFPCDLVVGFRDGHLYLAEAATGQRLELIVPTALNFTWGHFAPPLARFLAEVSRAATPAVTWFDWGAAWTLPFTPALHYRRVIVASARWQLPARALPGRTAPQGQWADAADSWRQRARVPSRVLLSQGDQHLPLDLSGDLGMDLLRAHLAAYPAAVLYEAPPPDADGWIGGRAHSIVVPVSAIR
jgi:lantibiotic biosynthesis protein